LTTVVVAVCVTLVVAPGAVWAIDTFSNVAVEDPVSGTKASVDSTHHLLVGDGSGPLTVDGSAVQTLPSTQKNPFRSEVSLSKFNTVGFEAVSNPTTATVALTHLAITSRVGNTEPWEIFLYEAEGATATDCVNSLSSTGLWANIAARAVGPGQTSSDDFTTPIILKPLHAGKSWCIVYGANPKTTTGVNSSLVMDYSGFVVTGTFTPSATLAAPGTHTAASP
jgi:hypothetical protein